MEAKNRIGGIEESSNAGNASNSSKTSKVNEVGLDVVINTEIAKGLYITDKTGKGKASHSHIVYLNGDYSMMSVESGHTHAIVNDNGVWSVLEEKGHTHIIEEYKISVDDSDESEQKIIEDVAKTFFETSSVESKSRELAYESEAMYMGNQWDDAVISKLRSEDRAAITVNKLEQKIDNLCGYQRQNRTDFKFLPQEGSDQAVADILTHLVKHITDQCYYSREESKVFEDCAITGRGLFNIYVDYDSNIMGDIVIERFPWDEGYISYHRKEDLSDCDMVFKEKWYSGRKLKEIYPDKFSKFSAETKTMPVSTGLSEDWDKRLMSSEFIDAQTDKYRLIERQMRVYKRSWVLIDTRDGFAIDMYGWSDADINKAKSMNKNFVKIQRVSSNMRITKIVSNILVEDSIIEDENDFSLVPLYAKKRNDEFWGKLESAKDLNRLVNKAYSQFVDIINKVANYGWFYDADTFADKRDREAFVRNSAKAGFVTQIRDTSKPPTKVEGVKFPSELVNAIQMFNNDMREVMNINLEMLGNNDSNMSGVSMKQKIVQQLIGNDYLFDNLAFVKKKIGSILVKKIAKVYTPERILRVLSNRNSKSIREGEGEIKITMPEGQVNFSEIDPAEITKLLKEKDIAKNDVIVAESETSASAMMGTFIMLLELAGKGLPIPPETVLEFAPIPHKEKILEQIANAQRMAAEAEQAKNQTEITKTLIAHQPKEKETQNVQNNRTPIMPDMSNSENFSLNSGQEVIY